jgi:hypothetical protein
MLGGLLTSIFLLEAFVAQIYSGPGAQVFPLVPTILFSLLVPNFVKLSTKFLEGMTQRENHRTRKGWDRSMALKGPLLMSSYLAIFPNATLQFGL